MSRDIRSFFAVKNPKNAQQNSSEKSVKTTVQKPGLKKRPIIIDSDSEEESSQVNAKRNKTLVDAKKQLNEKKANVSGAKSHYFECQNVSVDDIFGNTPVKRDTTRKIVKRIVKKEVKETHFDKDFEDELLKLDLISKEVENEVLEDKPMTDGKCSPPKIDSEVVNNNRKSPRKKKSDLDNIESPKKKFKPEDETDTSHSKTNDPTSPKCHKKESPVKIAFPKTPSPEKSSIKTLPLNKTPLRKSNSKILEKSPYNKLSINKEVKESSKKENCTKLNGDISHAKNSHLSKIEGISKTSPNKNKKISPQKEDAEENLHSKFKDTYEKKKHSSAIENRHTSDKKTDSHSKVDDEKKSAQTSSTPSNLWVERYKPTATKQIIGQQGEKSCVNKLIYWLKNWEKNHSGNKKLVKPSPWAKNDDGAFFKAALLSGPPGVGKTTTAHLVCKELGFDVVEFNASDTRSKRLLHEEVSELLSTKSLSPFFTGKGDQVTKKHVLLMDEVDGMAGNEDRGGVQELISLIKQARVPVICMCNDRNHPKIRSLSNYCFDLRFSKPRVEQIRGAMMSVCFKEKLKLKPDELTDIITSANQDIRLIMNHLSMLSMEKTSMANSTKHIKLGPWDIVRKIFSKEEHKTMSIHDKCDLFFHDYSVTPLFVQENYLNAVPHKPEAKNKIKKMELFANAARSLSYGDLTEKSIRSNNAWGLLPVQAVFSSLVLGDVLEGHLGAQINFPAWFGKNSRQTKMSRMVQELTVHSRLKISGNREAMNMDYLSSLERAITSPLLHDGADGVSDALAVLSEYCLVREDMESIAELCTWPGSKNRFAEVESKVKAAFTRAYNKTSAPTPYAAVPIKKGKGDLDLSEDLGEVEELGTQEDEEDEGLEDDAMIMVKKKPAGKKADKVVQPSTSKGTKTSKRGRKK